MIKSSSVKIFLSVPTIALHSTKDNLLFPSFIMFIFYCKINVCSIGGRAINQKAYFYKMKVSKVIFIFLLCLQFDWIYNQNLVKNYSFEERRKPDFLISTRV